MELAASGDPILLLAAMLLAVTGGDVVLLFTLVLGSSGLAGITTAFVTLHRTRVELRMQLDEQKRVREQDRIDNAAAVRTVAATEAESAMRVMGEAVNRVAADLAAEREARMKSDHKLEMCEKQCQDCLAQVRRLQRGAP